MARQSGAWTVSTLSAAALDKLRGGRTMASAPRAVTTGRSSPVGSVATPAPAPALIKDPGIKGFLERVVPGGETGYAPTVQPEKGIVPWMQRIIPGGETGFEYSDKTPGFHGGVVKTWEANGAYFWLNQDGTITVQKKNGKLKTYRPYKPTVFGKNPDAKKFIRMAKKHKKIWEELNKIFKKPTRRK